MHLELESFFDRLSSFENALEEQITKPKVEEKVEEVQEEKSSTQLLADAMSKFTKDSPGHMAPPIITEENLWIQLVHGGNLWNRIDRMPGQLIEKPSNEYLKTHFAL